MIVIDSIYCTPTKQHFVLRQRTGLIRKYVLHLMNRKKTFFSFNENKK